MIAYSYGDIVLVLFPFTDQSTIKKRPAVIVSSNIYNNKRPDIIVMAITSQLQSASYFGDIIVNNWQKAGLLKPSVIKPIFTTLEKKLIIKKLGALNKEDQLSLKESLTAIIGQA